MLTPVWSLEHVYNRPAALSVLHRFRYLSVLSNAWDQFVSRNSLPNVQGDVCLSPPCPRPVFCSCSRPSVLFNARNQCLSQNSLPNVPCPQLAVFFPCPCPSANIFTSSWLKMASPAGIGFHPVLRIFVSFAKDYLNHFVFRC